MWSLVVKTLGGLLGGPFVTGAVDAYRAKLDAGNTAQRLEHELAAKELEVQAREIDAQKEIRIAQTGRWYTPENLAAYVLVFYLAKVYLWDASLHLGSTDAVLGTVGDWGGMVMIFLFGKRGIENLARIIRK